MFKESIYLLLNNLIKIINKYIEIKDYTIVKDCFKQFKKNILIKIFIRYNTYNKTKFVSNRYCIISSRKKNCNFIVIVELENNYKDSKTNKNQ